MLFTRLGRWLAILAVVLGLFRIGMVVFILNALEPATRATAIASYLGHQTTGYYIDRGVTYVLFGIMLGVLTDIGRALARQNEIIGGAGSSKPETKNG